MFNCSKCDKEINFQWGVDRRTLCPECCDALEAEAAELAEMFEGNGTPLEEGCTLAGLLESLIADKDEQASIGDVLQAENEKLKDNFKRIKSAAESAVTLGDKSIAEIEAEKEKLLKACKWFAETCGLNSNGAPCYEGACPARDLGLCGLTAEDAETDKFFIE